MSQLKRFNGSEFEPVQSSSLITILKNVSNNNDLLYAGTSIYANTAGGSFTLLLPPAPVPGNHIQIHDSNNTFGTNNLTIDNNGQNINGSNDVLSCDIGGAIINLYYEGTGLGWKVQVVNSIMTVSSPALISLDGLTADYELQIGQTAVLNYTNATSVPLMVKTIEGEYEINVQNNLNTASTIASGALLANNTSYSGQWGWNVINNTALSYTTGSSSSSPSGWSAGGSGSAPIIGNGSPLKINIKVSTLVKSKTVLAHGVVIRNGTTLQQELTASIWNDTTTPWTSLGTITFPIAQAGKIIIKRII